MLTVSTHPSQPVIKPFNGIPCWESLIRIKDRPKASNKLSLNDRVERLFAVLTCRCLTIKDVADFIRVGEATVWQWIKQGELIAVGVGRE